MKGKDKKLGTDKEAVAVVQVGEVCGLGRY